MTSVVRTKRTSAGATSVSVVWSLPGGVHKVEHVGTAQNPDELEALLVIAEDKRAGNQLSLFDPLDLLGE